LAESDRFVADWNLFRRDEKPDRHGASPNDASGSAGGETDAVSLPMDLKDKKTLSKNGQNNSKPGADGDAALR
jgi:hypothetical protein